jgi:hypothetical protein
MSSGSWRRRSKDFIRRRLTELEQNSAGGIAGAAIVVFALAALLAPDVHSRSDANDLSGVFVGLLVGAIGFFGTYAAVVKTKSKRVLLWALIVGVAGLAAAVAGLLQLPLEAYRWAFAVAVSAIVYEGLMVLLGLAGDTERNAN